jgi:hypothetical protein
MVCTPHQISVGRSNREEYDGKSMWHVWRRGEVHTDIGWRNMKAIENLKDVGVDERIVLRCILKKSVWRAWIGLI